MKTYRLHKCQSQHRTVRTFLNCAIPKAVWVIGQGRYAVIAWCNLPTITLWETATPAYDALEDIDATACGSRCRKRHELVYIAGGNHA